MGASEPCPVHALAQPGRPGDGRHQGAVARRWRQSVRAEKLFAGSGHTFAEVLEAADSGKPLPRFTIPKRLKAAVAVKRVDVESQNVVAVLPGNDPGLKNEYVVLSAHLDHIGIGKPVNGDAIYWGAMDNASGVAAMLDIAANLKESGTRLRRSVLFLAVTGEEKGLLGIALLRQLSHRREEVDRCRHQYRHVHAVFPDEAARMVFGLDESDLGDDASVVAKSLDVIPVPDPEPNSDIFIRSGPVQLHPSRHPLGHDRHRICQRFARGEDCQTVADGALPRPFGRPEPASGQEGRRRIRCPRRPVAAMRGES